MSKDKCIILHVAGKRIALDEPDVDGWEFLDYRIPLAGENYYSSNMLRIDKALSNWREPRWIATRAKPEQKGFSSFKGVCGYDRNGQRCTKVEGGGECPHYVDEIITKTRDPATDICDSKTPDPSDPSDPSDAMKGVMSRLLARVDRLEKLVENRNTEKT